MALILTLPEKRKHHVNYPYFNDKRVVILFSQIILFILFLFTAGWAEATAQIPDQIIIDGRTERLFTEPLQGAFHINKRLETNIGEYMSPGYCSASWRGYVATWEVRNDELFLVKVVVDPCSDKIPVPLNKLFSDSTTHIKAIWFTGILKVPQGKQIEYHHMGYESRYESYLYLEVEKGNVLRSWHSNALQ